MIRIVLVAFVVFMNIAYAAAGSREINEEAIKEGLKQRQLLGVAGTVLPVNERWIIFIKDTAYFCVYTKHLDPEVIRRSNEKRGSGKETYPLSDPGQKVRCEVFFEHTSYNDELEEVCQRIRKNAVYGDRIDLKRCKKILEEGSVYDRLRLAGKYAAEGDPDAEDFWKTHTGPCSVEDYQAWLANFGRGFSVSAQGQTDLIELMMYQKQNQKDNKASGFSTYIKGKPWQNDTPLACTETLTKGELGLLYVAANIQNKCEVRKLMDLVKDIDLEPDTGLDDALVNTAFLINQKLSKLLRVWFWLGDNIYLKLAKTAYDLSTIPGECSNKNMTLPEGGTAYTNIMSHWYRNQLALTAYNLQCPALSSDTGKLIKELRACR